MRDSIKTLIVVVTGVSLSLITNLISGFIAPNAKKHEKWIWSVFTGLVGITIVVSYVPIEQNQGTVGTDLHRSNAVNIDHSSMGNTVIQSGGGDVTINSVLTREISSTTPEKSPQIPVRFSLGVPDSIDPCTTILIS